MRFITVFLSLFMLISCGKPAKDSLNVGTISGPETELVEVAQTVAAEKYGLDFKIIEFSDYNLPNEALQDGSLDANVYQHLPYLQAASKAHGYNFAVIGKTFVYPTGLYSKKYTKLSELPKNAVIAIPNDPSNEARALLLLQKAGLITLKTEQNASVQDIATNPRGFQFKELDAAQLPRVLPDVDAAVINTTFAIPAGLNPARDALVMENKDSPYANLIVVKADNDKKNKLEILVKSLNSPEVAQKAKELFGSAAIPAWQ
ncbi:29 kDa immunogenic protein [Legionella adelaidensis]|uniref:29 kDa immunogenic protein n=1 Tax=Legionella adelaidensis TaxID=45056 RepID=A0A0W0R3B1_9GAMM|nr:MetQ/NlpA family ABC transporter substrate-binding protein [Legionella adelaidensis]KTC65567.1 29 kDa immunogenic protein [Legionella adelaidensis]